MRLSITLAILALVASTFAFAGTRTVVPTTTLNAETGNNTSSSSTFVTQTNGNIGQANISKVPTSKLLYPGSTTPIYAHFMGWFGQTNHMNVGYTSSDATQVQRQVADAMSRGISGFLLDWYGPNNSMPNQTTFVLKSEAEAQNGTFVFGLVYDGGALNSCHATAGCDLTQQAISDLTYAYNNFEYSPAYLKVGGRPVVLFFDPDRYGTLNWSLIASTVPGNPLFIFRNSGGFTHASSSGGFSWVGGNFTTHLPALSYLDSFYSTSLSYLTDQTYGSSYKGFDDTLAAWGANRIVYQQCGQTWLQTFAQAGLYFSPATNQLKNFQIVTWNDYEEATEIETGIDNCFVVIPWISGNTLNWTTSGSINTVDHYTVFISSDGANLMSLGNVPVSATSFDLSTASMAAGNYTVYLKAVGMPSLTNKMSPAVTYSITSDLPPVPVLSVSPTSGLAPLTVTASTGGSYDPDGTITSSKIDFGDGSAGVSATSTTHQYTVAGTYTVTATVTDNAGLSASASVSVTVTADKPPLAALNVTPSSGLAPLTVTASTAGSSDPDGTIASSKIDFGDGSAAVSATSTTHQYTVAGTYTVTATVIDNAGLSANATTTVTVSSNKSPVAYLSVTPTSGNAPLTVTASTSGSYDPDGTISATKISFGDGTVAYTASATHTYNAPGNYTIVATLTDNLGALSTATNNVIVSAPTPPPLVAISLQASPPSATVAAGQSASYGIILTPSGGFTGAVSLSCSGVPAAATCSFAPKSPIAVTGTTPFDVTITTSGPALVGARASSTQRMPLYAMWLSGLGVAGMSLINTGSRKNKKSYCTVLIVALFALTYGLFGCGGNAGNPVAPVNNGMTAAGTYTVTIAASSGPVQTSTNVILEVR